MRDVIPAALTKNPPPPKKVTGSRSVILASADTDLRQRLRHRLLEMRWSVREAGGGAEAIACLEEEQPEAMLLDHWLPGLEINDFERHLPRLYPGMDLLRMNGNAVDGAAEGPRRQELLHVLRQTAEARDAREACAAVPAAAPHAGPDDGLARTGAQRFGPAATGSRGELGLRSSQSDLPCPVSPAFPEMIGQSGPMLELARLIKLVAPRSTTVLIEGETGTGKEIVAQALHRLSRRSKKPFTVLNCAAIPESLLEAELFGHARGAFTGAVGARVGRIEAADGGTLFLDEIGEMPLALQAKLLRFLECGELQRVGDNEITKVDVRVIAATHQQLENRSEEGSFRLDLYHRLAVFPLDVPALRERRVDIAALAKHLLARLAKGSAPRGLSSGALEALEAHSWPGNVRELAHVLERALILADGEAEIDEQHIRLRRRLLT